MVCEEIPIQGFLETWDIFAIGEVFCCCLLNKLEDKGMVVAIFRICGMGWVAVAAKAGNMGRGGAHFLHLMSIHVCPLSFVLLDQTLEATIIHILGCRIMRFSGIPSLNRKTCSTKDVPLNVCLGNANVRRTVNCQAKLLLFSHTRNCSVLQTYSNLSDNFCACLRLMSDALLL